LSYHRGLAQFCLVYGSKTMRDELDELSVDNRGVSG
jgi:hypothetical protein